MAQQRENRESMSQGVNQSGLPRPTSIPEVFDGPSDRTGPDSSAGPAMGETADPNFTAATRDRTDAHPDSKCTSGARVADLMNRDVAVCEPSTPLYYVARMMEERDCGAIPVVQSTDSMKPIVIVPDRDIVIRVIAKNQDTLALRAADVMSSGLLCVFPDMSIDECTLKMEEQQVRRAVVVDHTGRCCGIIAQ